MVGVSEQKEGLYYFWGLAIVPIVKISGESIFDLWHKWLGQPSSKVVELVLNVGFSKNNSLCNKVYDVCLKVKQSRDSFPISDNKSVDIF